GPLGRVVGGAPAGASLPRPMATVATTSDRQRRVTLLSFVTVFIAAAAYAVGIAAAGATGAAWGKVVASTSSVVVFYPLVRSMLGPTRFLRDLARPALAAAVGFGPLWLLTHHAVATALLGGAIYAGLVLALGVFDGRDRALLRQTLRLGA